MSGRREVMSGTGRLSFSAAGLSVSAGSCHRSLVAFCAVNGSRGLGPGAGPLVVDENSRVLVMEYEAWFGPNAVTFQGSAAMPLVQSKGMKNVGGGYDSADPAIIKQHLAWLEYMGADAAPPVI